jgi:hypothetical protein
MYAGTSNDGCPRCASVFMPSTAIERVRARISEMRSNDVTRFRR